MRQHSNIPDTYAPETDLPKVDRIPLWKVAVAVAIGLIVFTFAVAAVS